MQIERLETISGRGLLLLSNRYAEVEYVMRVFQEFHGEGPSVRRVRGGVKLPEGDVAFAIMDRKPIVLKLQDGRTANVQFTELDGSFVVIE